MAPLDLPLSVNASTYSLKRRWLGSRNYWLAQAAGWGGYIVLDSIGLLTAPANQRASETLESVAVALCGVFVTHLLRIPLLYHWRRSKSWSGLAMCVIPWWLALGTFYALMLSYFMLQFIFRDQLEAGTLLESDGLYEFATLVSFCLFFTGAWICAWFGILAFHGFRTAQIERLRLSAAIKEAELRALKAQINPHFLFNALNTIRALVPIELTAPRQAVTSLSELLRASLSTGQRERITLAEELAVVRHYLNLERLRHEARLQVDERIEDTALAWAVPPFSVQTLVENAVNHGIAQIPAGGTVRIEASVQANRLILEVVSPGRIRENVQSTGLGLQNARARLALLFGQEAACVLEPCGANEVRARMTIPPAPSFGDSIRPSRETP